MLMITKSNGELQEFSLYKLKQSLLRSGASSQLAESVAFEVQESIKSEERTSDIYKRAFRMLKKRGEELTLSRYNLKKAVHDLGPSGYPFEHFIAKLFKTQGYDVRVGVFLNGICVRHEIDVVASKGGKKILVETKFRNRSGDNVSIRTPLYMKSRFEDIVARKGGAKTNDFSLMIFTNTRFSNDAIRYARCSGSMKLVSWGYPRNNGLEKMIERAGLHPITVLDFLSKKEKMAFLKEGIVVCRDVKRNASKLRSLGLPTEKIEKAIEQANRLCNLSFEK